MFHNDSDFCAEWCEKIVSRVSKKVPSILRLARISCSCISNAGYETSSPSNLADFIAGKTTSVVPAILYDSNFVFPLAGNGEVDAKKYRPASGNQSCALRACKPICQFHGAAAPKNGVGKIVGALFSPKVVRFPADRDVLGYSSTFFSRREFRPFYHRSGAYDNKSRNNF